MRWKEFKKAVDKYIREEELKNVKIEFIDTSVKHVEDIHIYGTAIDTICIF